MTTANTLRIWRGRCGLLALLAALMLIPCTASSQLRPLVPLMLDNLGDVNRIGE